MRRSSPNIATNLLQPINSSTHNSRKAIRNSNTHNSLKAIRNTNTHNSLKAIRNTNIHNNRKATHSRASRASRATSSQCHQPTILLTRINNWVNCFFQFSLSIQSRLKS